MEPFSCSGIAKVDLSDLLESYLRAGFIFTVKTQCVNDLKSFDPVLAGVDKAYGYSEIGQ